MSDFDGGYPGYVRDDDTVLHVKEDKNHTEFWEEVVAPIVANKYKVSLSNIINLPYCQRRARIVGDCFYFGEKITKKLLKKIEKAVGHKLRHAYDEHETRCDISVSEFRSNIPYQQ